MQYSSLISTCEEVWGELQKLYTDIPETVIVVGSGGRRAATLYGHFAKDTWDDGNGNSIHEVLIVAEHLTRPAAEIFTTMLHEAVHGIANTRGVKDVSGRRHNKKFASICKEVYLIPPAKPDKSIGFSAATLDETGLEIYKALIDKIDEQLKLYRKLVLKSATAKPTSWLAICECFRKIRIGKSVKEEGQIVCQLCGTEFKVEDDEDDA